MRVFAQRRKVLSGSGTANPDTGQFAAHCALEHARTVAHGTSGTTLVESVVVMAILAILLSAMATTLAFGSRVLAQERSESNVFTLAGTVRTSIEDALRYSTVLYIGDGTEDDDAEDGTASSITFKQTGTSSYRPAGTYTLYMDDDGIICLRNAAGDENLLMPKSTYIRGCTLKSCTFSVDDTTYNATSSSRVAITITITSDTNATATTTFYVEPLGGISIDESAATT